MGGAADVQAMQAQQKAMEDQRRKQILAQDHGGHNAITGFSTNFEGAGGLHNLKNMIDNAQPDAIDTVVGRWGAVHTALTTAQGDLAKHTESALQTWEGPAARSFLQRSEQLQTSLGNAAEYVSQTGQALTGASKALRNAKTDIDAIHDASTWDKVKRYGATSDTQFKADLKSGIDLGTALQLDGDQLTVEEERHQQAVLVMEQLGANYNGTSKWLQNNRPPKNDGGVVYPPSSPPTTYSPVGPGGTTTSGPRKSGVTKGSVTGGGNANGVGDLNSLSPNSNLGTTGTGTVSPISGGTVSKLPNSPVTSVDGITGGLQSGSGSAGSGVLGSGVSGLGGLGGSGSSGLSTAGLGSGLSGSALSGEALASERALASGAAGERAGMGSGEGMMGGMGGLGRGNGKKNKRKQRAAYLVEDEETWEQGVKPNPPVIG